MFQDGVIHKWNINLVGTFLVYMEGKLYIKTVQQYLSPCIVFRN